jgi:hypothetical protein
MDTQVSTALDMSPEACVARGAALLDRTVADWRGRITHPLNMVNGDECVAGQVFNGSSYFGGWGNARRFFAASDPDEWDGWASDRFMAEHGFFVIDDSVLGHMDEWATVALTPLWRSVIESK